MAVAAAVATAVAAAVAAAVAVAAAELLPLKQEITGSNLIMFKSFSIFSSLGEKLTLIRVEWTLNLIGCRAFLFRLIS